MRERNLFSGDILHETFLPVMLQRAKYSRFRNDSLTSTEDGPQSISSNAKGCVSACNSATSPLPIENITLVTQDSSTTLCTLIPKMSHFKLSSPSSLLGFKHFSLGTKEVPRTKLTESHAAPSSTTSAKSSHLQVSNSRQDADVNAKIQNDCLLLETETLHVRKQSHTQQDSHNNMGKGISYYVIYMGCIEVLQSMRSLDFGTRTQVTREAISRLCEAVPNAKGATKTRKPPLKFLYSVLGKSNLQFSGINVILTISTNCLTLTNADTKQVIANHHMQSISFASGGDPDTTDYVAYVAKDPVNQRACHILECSNTKAQEVISSIGQAFELRFKQYLRNPSFTESNDTEILNLSNTSDKLEHKDAPDYYNELPRKMPPADNVLDRRTRETLQSLLVGDEQCSLMGYYKNTNIYENCIENPNTLGSSPRRGLNTFGEKHELFDDPCYINTVSKKEIPDQTSGNHSLKSLVQDPGRKFQGSKTAHCSSMQKERWYHGKMSRKVAESLLITDGDFLVRESTSSASQYVLSGLHGGQPKHLLLVDPEGKVRTKDHMFESVSHLIKYHVENKVPIISSGSELCLRHPVEIQEI
ncbi:SHC-transforming protein 4 [Spea bombifrons]|uniref:SHC-transforming protein 4 n=1 Tax=Spea bombifrons TaxID=233779 RepID=UPI00234B0D77|nr:SHC-transforming protein 4 [Spea bombifrons]